jgi:hypothetical protein
LKRFWAIGASRMIVTSEKYEKTCIVIFFSSLMPYPQLKTVSLSSVPLHRIEEEIIAHLPFKDSQICKISQLKEIGAVKATGIAFSTKHKTPIETCHQK